MSKGKFITLEGIEGAGKSSAMTYIRDYLLKAGKHVVLTREPGGTEIAEKIRELLLAHYDEKMFEETELLLMFASRVQHMHAKILPHLNAGDWVLSDRFADASIAYQGGGRQMNKDRLLSLKEWALNAFSPDVTILLDVPAEVGLSRVEKRADLDRIESEQVDFFERVRETYLSLARFEPARFRVVDASVDIDEVHVQLEKVLKEIVK